MKNENQSTTIAPSRLQSNSSSRRYSHEEISACARAIWEERGKPAGQDEQIWLEAERKLRGLSFGKNEDPGFADPRAPLDKDGEPTGRVDKRLNQTAAQPKNRSATSL